MTDTAQSFKTFDVTITFDGHGPWDQVIEATNMYDALVTCWSMWATETPGADYALREHSGVTVRVEPRGA